MTKKAAQQPNTTTTTKIILHVNRNDHQVNEKRERESRKSETKWERGGKQTQPASNGIRNTVYWVCTVYHRKAANKAYAGPKWPVFPIRMSYSRQ